jgi:hypothetical protein
LQKLSPYGIPFKVSQTTIFCHCTKPFEVKEQYERQLRELQEAYGEAMLELRARKKLSSLLGNEDDK